MQVNTKAVVISSIKYGDSGLIVKCFTQEDGIRSYLLRGVLKKKKGKIHKSQFFPLSLLQINASHNNKGNLNSILEAKTIHLFQTIHTSFVKQSVVFFLSEFLSNVLREEEGENEVLFEFLENTILWLDHHDQIANFHLKFLIDLTKSLGFYPDRTNEKGNFFFDLSAGKYVSEQGVNVLHGDDLKLFNKVLGMKFDVLEEKLFHKRQRIIALDLLLKYYQLHVASFKRPKSINILSEILE